MSRRLLTTAIGLTALALAALLAYSLERTAWLFGRFEDWTPAAYAAAGVVELAAVALIVGASALAGLAPAARAWANRALLAVLSVGALANLSAGYLRGGAACAPGRAARRRVAAPERRPRRRGLCRDRHCRRRVDQRIWRAGYHRPGRWALRCADRGRRDRRRRGDRAATLASVSTLTRREHRVRLVQSG